MKIIAIIRQIPEDARSMPDHSGVEAALRLKKQTGGSVTAVCLGSGQALSLLREAVAMGCDDALLISDPAFEGSDPAGCASILAAAIAPLSFDVICVSCYAVDADAIQIGFLLAERLNLTQTGYVEEITCTDGRRLTVKRQFEDRIQLLELHPPCLISALPQPNKRIYRTAEGITRAYAAEIPVLTLRELEKNTLPVDSSGSSIRFGRDHSSVQLLRSYAKKERKRGNVLTVPTDEAVTAILDTMIKNHIL